MNTGNRDIKSHKVVYVTSLDKWRGIRVFADINGLNTDKIDAMISWIEERGDSSLEGMECSVDIHNLSDYLNSIYNNMDHPCPHCKQYDCTRCPLYRDGYVGCCSEWKAVKEDIANLLYGA